VRSKGRQGDDVNHLVPEGAHSGVRLLRYVEDGPAPFGIAGSRGTARNQGPQPTQDPAIRITTFTSQLHTDSPSPLLCLACHFAQLKLLRNAKDCAEERQIENDGSWQNTYNPQPALTVTFSAVEGSDPKIARPPNTIALRDTWLIASNP